MNNTHYSSLFAKVPHDEQRRTCVEAIAEAVVIRALGQRAVLRSDYDDLIDGEIVRLLTSSDTIIQPPYTRQQ